MEAIAAFEVVTYEKLSLGDIFCTEYGESPASALFIKVLLDIGEGLPRAVLLTQHSKGGAISLGGARFAKRPVLRVKDARIAILQSYSELSFDVLANPGDINFAAGGIYLVVTDDNQTAWLNLKSNRISYEPPGSEAGVKTWVVAAPSPLKAGELVEVFRFKPQTK
jgi:hypothetical protein